MDKNLKRRNW